MREPITREAARVCSVAIAVALWLALVAAPAAAQQPTFSVSNQPVGLNPQELAAGGVNSDSRTDLVVSNLADETITVLLQQPGGVFNSRYLGLDEPRGVAIGNVAPDPGFRIAVNSFGEDEIVLLSPGSGGGFSRESVPVTAGPIALALSQVGEDKLLASIGDEADDVDVLRPSGSGFSGTAIYGGQGATDVAGGDIDGDGTADLAISGSDSNVVSIILEPPGGQRVDLGVGESPQAVATGVVTPDDALLDLASANSSGTVSVLTQQEGGVFDRQDLNVASQPNDVAIGDLTGDGLGDLVASSSASNAVSVLTQTSDGGFERTDVRIPGGPNFLALGDYNSDGRNDIAVSLAFGSAVALMLNTTAAGDCAGQTATIAAAAGQQVVAGTRGADVIVGSGDGDRIEAGAGDDLVCSGGGADVVSGGAGDDQLQAGGGRDQLGGNAGDDSLRGGAGSDRCRGHDGDDDLRACER